MRRPPFLRPYPPLVPEPPPRRLPKTVLAYAAEGRIGHRTERLQRGVYADQPVPVIHVRHVTRKV